MTQPNDSSSAVRRMLEAESVAVVGASGDPDRIGYLPVEFLVKFGYTGRVYPVNPKLDEVNGLVAYKSLSDLPEVPDLVAIMVAARLVPSVLHEAGRLGVPSAIIISSGFAEVGGGGVERQNELADIIAETGIRVCGPNSVGVIHASNHMAVTFTAALTKGDLAGPGNIGIVSQSGAFGTVLYGLARDQGLKLHSYISAGNGVDLDVADYIGAMVDHPDVTTIGGYIETIRDGEGFSRAAMAAREAQKPVVLVKVGRSAAGAQAAASHTGAMTGNDQAYDAVFRRSGVARALDEQHLLDVLQAFDVLECLPTGNRISIASMSGGAGVLLCDAAEQCGLDVPPFPPSVTEGLRAILPEFASIANPVDFTGQFVSDTAGLHAVLSELQASPTTDAVILFAGLGWTAGGAWVDPVIEASKSGVPLIVVSPLATRDQCHKLRLAGVPIYPSPAQAIRVLKTLVDWNSWSPSDDIEPKQVDWAGSSGSLAESAAKKLLADAGLRVPAGELAATPSQASDAASRLGPAVVMKIQADAVLHKTEVGGVRVGVPVAEVADVFETMVASVKAVVPDSVIDGVLVEEFVEGGVEAVIGSTWQEPFGHVVMVGLGGAGVELLGDVAFGLAPLSTGEAHAMIESLRGYPLLDGFRGAPKADVDALAEAVSEISRIVSGLGPRLRELDLNPVKVLASGEGVVILDALAVMDTH